MITLTEKATTKVGELIAAEDEAGMSLRVTARPGGCSGNSYEMYFDTETAADDVEVVFGAVRVVVDPSSAELLVGATLDYNDDLAEAGFSIDNPNTQSGCGCGKNSS
ncbi:MAG TPA: iron-sulfur cluster assembly accessory protein [Acidimicrobiales bacterium]|jgi:iron-sulfur cluster assembly protein/iron-sulfur cluster insertion protein|nr:iron-sulfur cluster assembly accessory protein [Acidimicrobiales bacterium]MDP6280723.1 iron-sulfur cluster assembly accessory protein [Acidimicrobiales bacterium]MDP7117159.1 iron-sulfur cluster assembly accessory protein [Acidimicrobiales bacterium]MDP7410220.1 iron-sulfur cluster assembly accessory protein [Acidimicrobiales bacterium]MEE1521490.1 iron-sulfur cluster assembly accessory protein [Acidimicrobiales bacterium]|tara:strand:- start:2801 stop:3121 length:321 start_codon:yes stop_codon:yes gene_type:complete